jgi:multiple sugar transport system ATP-binding protein
MDEPLSNLDAKLRVSTRTQIASLQQRLGITTVYVTHDQVEAMTMGDRVAVMKDGLLQQVDTPLVLYDDPVNLFVAGFIGSPAMNLLEAELTEGGATVFGHTMQIPLTPEVRRRHTGSVTIGIRPEYFQVAPDETGLPVTVSVVEELGADAYVYGIAGASLAAGDVVTAGTPIVARIPARSKIQRGSTIHVTVRPEDCRVFATETGERLDPRG